MARKTSNQTIEKIEEQIDHLKDETYSIDDITPILDSEVIKKNQEATSSPKKKTSTKRSSSTSSSTRKTSTTKKSTSTTKRTTSTTRKKTTTRDDIVVAPEKKTTKKTTTTKNVRDKVVVSDKPTRTRKTKKTTTKDVEDSIKKKNESLQENVEKIVDAIKEDNLDQEIADISLEEFVVDEKNTPVEDDNLEKEIEAIVQGETEENHIEEEVQQEILEDSTFIDDSKKIMLDDELDFPFDYKKEEETSPIEKELEETLDDTVEILHSGETSKLDKTIKKAQEIEDTEDIEILHSGETKELDNVVKVTRYDDYDLDHIDQLDEYDVVSEFEKDILEDVPKKEEEKPASKKPLFPRIKKKSTPEDKDSYQDLEDDLRSLYDRVNDVVDDFDPNAKEDDYIDFIQLKNKAEVKAPPKKKFSFHTLKKNLSSRINSFISKFKRKKKPIDRTYPIEEKYRPKKVRKDFEKLSKPRPEKRKKVREVEEYDNVILLDYISQRVLNVLIAFFAVIFALMCIAFVLFVYYVSTF